MLKRQLLLLAVVTLVAPGVMAQTLKESQSELAPAQAVTSTGFRVALVRPFMKAHIENKFDGQTRKSDKESLDSGFGVSLGYAQILTGKIGFTGALTLIEFEEKSSDDNETYTLSMARVEGNLAWGLTDRLYMRGGANLSRWVATPSEITEDFNPGIGVQLGGGFQFTKNVGLDLAYVLMSQRETFKLSSGRKSEVTIIEQGPEVALTATF